MNTYIKDPNGGGAVQLTSQISPDDFLKLKLQAQYGMIAHNWICDSGSTVYLKKADSLSVQFKVEVSAIVVCCQTSLVTTAYLSVRKELTAEGVVIEPLPNAIGSQSPLTCDSNGVYLADNTILYLHQLPDKRYDDPTTKLYYTKFQYQPAELPLGIYPVAINDGYIFSLGGFKWDYSTVAIGSSITTTLGYKIT